MGTRNRGGPGMIPVWRQAGPAYPTAKRNLGVTHPVTEDSTPRVPRYLLEGCAVDPLVDDPHLCDLAVRNQQRGCVELYATSLTRQDLAAVKEPNRRSRLEETLERLAPLEAALPAVVVDEQFDRARPSYPSEVLFPVGPETAQLLQRLRVNQRADARQAAAAAWLGAALVTDDRSLRRRAEQNGIRAIDTRTFAEELARVAPEE